MKKYFKYLKDNWTATIISPILMMIDAIGGLVQPFFMSKLIDVGIKNGDTSYIIKMGLLMILFAAIAMICGFLCMYFSAKAAYGFSYNLRKEMMEKIEEFSFNNINKFKTSSLITRITNDITVLSNLFQMLLRIVVRAPFMFIGGSIMALFINKKLTLVIVLAIPILFLFLVFLISRVSKLFEKLQKSIDKVNSVMRENLKGIRVIKSFIREKYQIKKFKEANDELTQTGLKAFNNIVLMMPGVSLIMYMTTAVVLSVGARLALNKEIEIGALSSFITYIMMILSSLIMMCMVFINFARAKASSKRVLEVLEEQSDVKNTSSKKLNKVEKITYKINNYSYKYSSGESVLKDIEFTINKGDKVAIIGGTGTGKTTIINLLNRFYDIEDGYIKINDINIKNYDISSLRSRIGLVPQENRLFKGTILSNLKWGNKSAKIEEIRHACKVAQIDSFIENTKDKYNSIVEQKGSNFSGGQKQRLCIARALIKKPDVLILDDSVSALDSTTERKLMDSLQKEYKDMIIINITQRVSSCKKSDYVIVLDNGTIDKIGTHNELLKKSKIYKEINNSQQEVLSHEE